MPSSLVMLAVASIAVSAALHAADIDVSETVQLPMSHSLQWVRRHTGARDEAAWNGVLDEERWGTPSPKQQIARNWIWELSDEAWRQAVVVKGGGEPEDVTFKLWIPEEATTIRGIVVMSGHGSGTALFEAPYLAPQLQAIARDLHLATFMFVGNPVQRGFWPRRLLDDRLRLYGERVGHPELAYAPLFLYGHSNGTGFSAIYPATEKHRVWAWVSMRPGTTFQVYQPAAATVPGLVIFGEDDQFVQRPSIAENLAVVPSMRRNHAAVWNMAVEPHTGHGPGPKTWPLVFSFLRHTFAARVPADADPGEGPVILDILDAEDGWLGANWDPAKGGYQDLPIAPYADFPGDKATASWLINAAYAADWQAFQRTGEVPQPNAE